MSEKKTVQLDIFGNHKEIEDKKEIPKKKSKKKPIKSSKQRFIVDYDEAIQAIKKSYQSFLNVDPSIRAKLEIKDLAFETALKQTQDTFYQQYYLLERPGSHPYAGISNDDDYLTLKIAEVGADTFAYMEHISGRLKNDVNFFKQLYKVRPHNFRWDYLEYAGNQVTSNKDIIQMAVKASASEFKYIHSSLVSDYSFLASLYIISHKEITKSAKKGEGSEEEWANFIAKVTSDYEEDEAIAAIISAGTAGAGRQLYNQYEEEVIEYFDESIIENTTFLEKLPPELREKASSHSHIKAAQDTARYELVKKELEEFILSHGPKNIEDVMTVFASLNISFDYKYNKDLGSPEIVKGVKIKTDLRSLIKAHLKRFDCELNRDTNYEDEDPQVGEWEGDKFTEFEQGLIDLVNQGIEIPKEYFLDENSAPSGDGLDPENIGERAVILDVVDEKNSGLGFFAAYRDKTIFWEHASCYIDSDQDFNPIEILDECSFVLKNKKRDISTINSYILRLKEEKYRWYDCAELGDISEKLPELLWEILDSIYDEIYYCNNFGTLAKVLGAAGPDMWELSNHCLVCKKGKTIDFMTSCVSL